MSVLANSVLVINGREKFVRILCIYYLIQFQGGQKQENQE